MPIHGDQNWRKYVGQDDPRNLLVERNESKLQELEGSFLFLCAHRHHKGGLLDMMRDGGLRAGFRRAILGQIDRDK